VSFERDVTASDRAAVVRALRGEAVDVGRPLRFRDDVFLNVPFDDDYEPLFVALIAGLVAFRRRPRCVLEIPSTGKGRLARIFDLLRGCGASVHDLSRVTLSGPPGQRTPRFNMPFELGLACALDQEDDHPFIVLEAVPYRLLRSLSDLGGIDAYVHRGSADGVLAALSDWLGTRGNDPTPRRLRRLHELVFARARGMQRELGAGSLFTPTLFRRITLVASLIAENMRLASRR
jgi:hypothetical protein